MKAVFQLTPAESKRLIAKAVVKMPEVQAALERAYVIVPGGTTNAMVAQELLGTDVVPARFTAGISTHRLLCVTNPPDRQPFPIIIHKGQVVAKTIPEALGDFHRETVIIKGGNAIDLDGNVGVITSGFDGGTVAVIIGTVTSQGLTIIAPVGLEKLVPSVKDSALYTGAKTYDYTMGADFGMYCLTKTKPVTELVALKILFGIEAKLVAAGGVGGSEGAVVLVAWGEEAAMRQAIALVESIKGEPQVRPMRGTCATCRYACYFAGKQEADLPAWLQRTAWDIQV